MKTERLRFPFARSVGSGKGHLFKGAPEITFWGGQRFYDSFQSDSQDYFGLLVWVWAGVKNIDVGYRQTMLAYWRVAMKILPQRTWEAFNKHRPRWRLKDIQIGPQMMLVVSPN